jgi:hypothetical protein
VAKLVARLLATSALWFEFKHLSKVHNVRHKQRSGQHTLARQKMYTKKKVSLNCLFQKNFAKFLFYRNFGSEEFLTVEEVRREVTSRGGEVRARISGYILQIMEDTLTYRAHAPADGTR